MSKSYTVKELAEICMEKIKIFISLYSMHLYKINRYFKVKIKNKCMQQKL